MGQIVRLQSGALSLVSLFVDTSVWSLALRRDAAFSAAEVMTLRQALEAGDMIVTTGLVLQELLQGFAGPCARREIIERFAALPLINPDRQDHVEAADRRNRCRRSGLQIGTIDALPAGLCIRHSLTLVTTDKDFSLVAARFPLRLWNQKL